MPIVVDKPFYQILIDEARAWGRLAVHHDRASKTPGSSDPTRWAVRRDACRAHAKERLAEARKAKALHLGRMAA
jgi:hypothetical protein